MYIGTNYNSYYNTIYSNKSVASLYQKTSDSYVSKASTGLYSANTYNSTGIQFVQGLKTGAAGLKNAINAMTSGSAFNKRAVTSSDSEAMSVALKSGRQFSAVEDASVRIKQLAAGQKNEGATLDAKAATGESGISRFEIEIAGKKTALAVSVDRGDTNKDVQQKMADAVNSAKLGLNASVSTDKDGKTSLVIAAQGTGEDAKNSFIIRDTAGSLVKKLGANNIVQDAQNAVYSVNGGADQVSKSNTVDIGAVTATLKKVTAEAKISTVFDKESALAKLQEFADSYNELYKTAASKGDDPKIGKLFTKMLNVGAMYAGSLSEIGIGFNEDGLMQVNTDIASKAIESGKTEQFFTENRNRNFGYTSQLSKIAADVGMNTAKYVGESNFDDISQSLTDFNNSFFGIFRQSSTNRNFNIGMLLDFML